MEGGRYSTGQIPADNPRKIPRQQKGTKIRNLDSEQNINLGNIQLLPRHRHFWWEADNQMGGWLEEHMCPQWSALLR